MNELILRELNSIGAGFDVPMKMSRRLPEKILVEALTYAYQDTLIGEMVLALVDQHKDFYNPVLINNELKRLMLRGDQLAIQGLIFAYSIFSQVGVLDADTKRNIGAYLSRQKIEDVFPAYETLSFYALNIGEVDPVLKELGLCLPIVKRAPNKKIKLNPANFRNQNVIMRRRICEFCSAPTEKVMIRDDVVGIDSVNMVDLAEANLVKMEIRPFYGQKFNKSSKIFFYRCSKCGCVSKLDRAMLGKQRESRGRKVKAMTSK